MESHTETNQFFIAFHSALRTPIDRIYFAGTETAVKWSGYMDGAVEAGERAAREVLCRMGKITEDKIWIDELQSVEEPLKTSVDSYGERFLPSSILRFLKLIAFMLFMWFLLFLTV
ncbi:amine oxidase B [Nephila pilipes]|uniref:Amine oxidase n=1 Tax=Nephila pilipes TaxID=299642 RepID=A0A8X6TDR7_NEPPI|nr:amine oxidase B [Nephila pilipes]